MLVLHRKEATPSINHQGCPSGCAGARIEILFLGTTEYASKFDTAATGGAGWLQGHYFGRWGSSMIVGDGALMRSGRQTRFLNTIQRNL